ncbi:hypothetical protein KI387_012431 [Taxus chinensis]|uniref:Glycosyltransferases n=1 Tax=Taxus chinensis TaxID=29808 RepID=A0AA38FFX7_TAXCH|nr:hypothetical protein KI387_012431 [Taxus chinensis]
MASFRRTLSPATHERSLQNGDIFSVSSPSHKFLSPLSHSTSAAPPTTASVFSSIGFLPVWVVVSYVRAFLIGIHPSKLSRSSERSKAKVQVWKRPLLHFFLCFVLGLLIGFTPFSMESFSINLASKHQDFAFEIKTTEATNPQQKFGQVGNRGRTIEAIKVENTKNLELEVQQEKEADVLAISTKQIDPLVGLSPVRILDFVPRKLLIVVTPTYNRAFQAFYLNRLAHTLKLVAPPVLWIVVEMHAQSMETADLLRKTGVMYRHLVCDKNVTNVKDRGIHQRNIALSHIEQHQLNGIVYFADDDNMYTLELFEQLREIRRFGTWPVGMLAQSKNKAILEGPVCNGSQVTGWHTNERSKRLRRFHVDMSGFAFNSTILWDPQRWHRRTNEPIRQLDTVKEGFQETTFIEQVVEDESQMEGLPNDCSKVMVWHLHSEAPGLAYPPEWILEKNLDVIVPVKK